MGKRSDFAKIDKDKYNTPAAAVEPLFPYLPAGPVRYIEPCAGRGDLVRHLNADGLVCVYASDIAPENLSSSPMRIVYRDATTIAKAPLVITNPPWTREVLHPIIRHFLEVCPAWYLFDADWMHTRQASALLLRCAVIVPVGRIKWIPDSEHTGKDNCCWYFFPTDHHTGPVVKPRI